jgi:glycosyltransferase involved in cell wall biosynthesis
MFSIIIPVGPGRDARPALTSLAGAGLGAGDEVIVVGDGHLPPIDAGFAALPLRTLATPARAGANAARNHGARAARNGVLCFLDDDDQYAPGWRARLAAIVAADPACGAWSLGWRIQSGRRQRFARRPRRITERSIWRRNLAGGCSSMLVRKEIFAQAGGFDAAMPAMQDWDLWLRLSRITTIAAVPPPPLVVYRDHSGPRISTDPQARVAGLARLLEKHGGHWPGGVRALHRARLTAARRRIGQARLPDVFQWRAPLASLWFIFFAPGG